MLDKSHIGLVCKSPRAKTETQITALRAAGADWIVEIGKTPRTWREAISAIRPGDTVYVYALSLLPTRRGEDDLSPGAQVSEFLIEVHERGASVTEVYTGRNSRDRKARRGMIADAHKALRRGSRALPPTGRGRGRPPKEFDAEQLAAVKAAWLSPDYTTNEAAAKRFPKGFTAKRAWQLFGPSGRTGKVKKKRKR